MAQMPEAIILRKTEETKTGVTYCIADVKTNADRIRAMNDEELAEWLAKQEYKKPTFDGWLPLCNKVMGPRICHEDGCEKCWLEWLKSPVEVSE